MGATGYQHNLSELEAFIQDGRDLLVQIQNRIDRVDWTYYTESRLEENEENKAKMADIRELVRWATELIEMKLAEEQEQQEKENEEDRKQKEEEEAEEEEENAAE